MSEKPILFNTQMVKVILEGRKTQTRRIAKSIQDFKKQDSGCIFWNIQSKNSYSIGGGSPDIFFEKYVPCQIGDTLWVRETWSTEYDGVHDDNGYGRYVYKADGKTVDVYEGSSNRWYPSIHMPREAARLFLKVTDVTVERLNDITEEQAKCEGFSSKFMFMAYWDAIYKNWSENPWVWVIEFERVV
jgi:uncharacterized protein YqfB (UPF0267 family)